MKRKISIYSSLISLFLCFSILVGSTFALFTSESKTNIAITSGKVEVEAYIDEASLKTYSMGVEQSNNTFENGGKAVLSKDTLSLELLTPGDKVEFAIKIKNNSNVNIKYQTIISLLEDNGLFSGLNITINGESFNSTQMRSNWKDVAANASIDEVANIVIELPVSAGDTYQEKSAKLEFAVSAVQGNAAVTFPNTNVIVNDKLAISTNNNITTNPSVYKVDGEVVVTVPTGVVVENGLKELGIEIKKVQTPNSNIVLGENEIITTYDVHVSGIDSTNTVPVIVEMYEVLPKNLNSSAIKIYHNENENQVPMTYVSQDLELQNHNEFKYDPATGNLTVALASFSEIALLVDTTNPWDGTADKTWYDSSATEYSIRNAQQLAGLAQIVSGEYAVENSGDTFDGKTIKIEADIDLSSEHHTFYPIGVWVLKDENSYGSDFDYIGKFQGTFDGMGHTISGLSQNGWEMNGSYNDVYYCGPLGLFGYLSDATIQNLNIDSFKTVMEFSTTGCVAAFVEGECTFSNISVTNADMSTCNTAVAGIVGWDLGDKSNLTFKNITVDATNTFHSLWGIHDTAASGILGYLGENSSANFDKCNVSCVLDVYNDFVGAYQWGIYRYSGMFIGSVHKTTTEDDRKICDLSNVTASNCTVNFGDWHDSYYYCEFESNGHPSYAGEDDYKYSRVPDSELVKDAKGNVIGCNHVHTDVEDGRAIQFVFDSVFGSYGNWGVSPVDLEKYPAIAISDVTNASEKFAVKFENTDKYLYRVGNGNAVSLGSLFTAIEGKTINQSGVYVSITKLDQDTDVSGTYIANTSDWTKGTLKFTGTGPVKLTIQDYSYCKPTELLLEVVDANNVTQYSELKNQNSVLLNDITMSSDGKYYLSNATLYGNGFTFDVTAGKHGDTEKGSSSNNYVVCLVNSTLDNVKVVGSVYTEYGAQVKDDYNFPIVLSTGNNVISNSYISNGSAPIRIIGGTLVVENTTLKGGNFANLDIRGGQVELDNIVTINQIGLNDTANGSEVAGLGIVSYYEGVTDAVRIKIKNGITQYNHLQESDANYIKDSSAKQLFNAMFNYSDAIYTDGSGNKWVNTGIISLMSTVGDANISDIDGYIGIETSLFGVSGFAYVPVPSAPTTSAPEWVATTQGSIAPSYSFDYTTKNYVAKTDNSNDYCYEDDGIVRISFDEGDTFNWDTSILSAEKNGQTLPYTVSMNGIDYTGKSITFDESGEYTIVYTYTDSNNYVITEGNVGTTSKTYEKTVTISVSAVKATAKHAEFTFGTSNTSSITKTIDNNTYVMPNVTDADKINWGYINVNGERVYYPITNAKSETSLSKVTAYFFTFKDIVTITDYNDNVQVIYDTTTTEWPIKLDVVKGSYGEITSDNIWTSLNDTGLDQSGGDQVFKYAADESNPAAIETKDGALCYKSASLNADPRDKEYYTVAQYKYEDNAGAVYYYYVGYKIEKSSNADSNSDGGCVTPDTLITMADGSQKEVQYLQPGEEVLVWNFFTGELDTAPVLFNDVEQIANVDVVYLTFSDGTEVKVITEHGFFDVDLGKYIYLDENAADYIGHSFDKLGTIVELVSVEIRNEYEIAWSPVTYGHLCYYVNGMLSMPGGIEGMFNYFDVDPDTMMYDAEQMQADIEEYGLFTYEEFAAIVPINELMFDALGGQYLKVSIGKGLTTLEELKVLAQRYAEFFE